MGRADYGLSTWTWPLLDRWGPLCKMRVFRIKVSKGLTPVISIILILPSPISTPNTLLSPPHLLWKLRTDYLGWPWMYWHDENQLRHGLIFKAMGVCENEGLHVLCLVAQLCLTHTYLSPHLQKKSVLMYFGAYFLIVTCKILVLLSILACKMSFIPWELVTCHGFFAW